MPVRSARAPISYTETDFLGELLRMEPTIDNYDDALRQTTREAKATLLAAVGIALFFWAAIFLLEDAGLGPAGFPVWFWWAVAGGFVLSCVVVVWLVKCVFRNFSLDLRPENRESGASEMHGVSGEAR